MGRIDLRGMPKAAFYLGLDATRPFRSVRVAPVQLPIDVQPGLGTLCNESPLSYATTEQTSRRRNHRNQGKVTFHRAPPVSQLIGISPSILSGKEPADARLA